MVDPGVRRLWGYSSSTRQLLFMSKPILYAWENIPYSHNSLKRIAFAKDSCQMFLIIYKSHTTVSPNISISVYASFLWKYQAWLLLRETMFLPLLLTKVDQFSSILCVSILLCVSSSWKKKKKKILDYMHEPPSK